MNPGDFAVPGTLLRTAGDGLTGLGRVLALGPEPSLSASTPARAGETTSTPQAAGRLPGRRWLIGAGAIGVAAVVTGVLFGFGLLGRAGPHGNGPTGTSSGSQRGATRSQPVAETPPATATAGAPEVPAGRAFAVKTPDGDTIGHKAYVAAVTAAANRLVAQRYLLPEDAARLIAQAQAGNILK